MERFLIPKLEERIAEVRKHIYTRREPISPVLFRRGWEEAALLPTYQEEGWEVIRPGAQWGERDLCALLRCWFCVPAGWRKGATALRVQLAETLHVSGPEALAYIDGEPCQGVDLYHDEIPLAPAYEDGRHLLVLEAHSGTKPIVHRFAGIELVETDEVARTFYYDAWVALEAAKLLDANSWERAQILNALDEAIRLIDFREPLGRDFRRSLAVADAALRASLYEREWPGERPEVVGVGHAHIDVAWLWTLRHTRKKTLRTFLNVLRLMERYPEFRFTQSQPQLYAFCRQDEPTVFQAVRQRAQAGQWEPTGGLWLEADTNITGGESLVRQVLFGKRFLRDEFGLECEVVWLPDAFGYTWALPQIMNRAGLRYFMTTKISWNEFNQFPYDTFLWQGIDGSRVLAHFITTPSGSWFATYNGRLTPAEVKGTWDAYKQKRLNSKLLTSCGYGDGGGGPNAEMLEVARRLANMPGLPRFRWGTAREYFSSLEPLRSCLPVWNGELYLEFHRGTYTSQGRTKRNNRKAEVLYHTAEALAAAAHWLGAPYPKAQFNEGWQLILLNQFHDILPGSSIGDVYEESNLQYQHVFALAEAASSQALLRLSRAIAREGRWLILYNPAPFPRHEPVALPGVDPSRELPVQEDGSLLPFQVACGTEGEAELLVLPEEVPPYGWRAYRLATVNPSDQSAAKSVHASAQELENEYLRVRLDAAGRLISVWDKRASREVLADSAVGNEFQVFEDKPLNNDAWNIDIFYQEKRWVLDEPAQLRVLESGPLRATVEWQKSFRSSRIVQRITLQAECPRLDFHTWVDWHERHLLLKVAFPLAVHTHRATYEIQFGAIERPTHWNTSWDYARFEVPAQRWADLSEGDYGASLLNDCKYGYDARDNVLRLTLIKCATSPDPEADQGQHLFSYSLYPHAGDWRKGTLQQAVAFNIPLQPCLAEQGDGALPLTWSFLRSASNNIVVETIKKAEDDDALIVRAYEAFGQRGRATLIFGPRIRRAVEVNLLEQDEQPVSFDGHELAFSYRPFDLRTFKVWLEPPA